jgi:GPH family glycoside/pentoside/hexuronide:cation symporter
MLAQKKYSFIVSGEENLEAKNITIIDQKRGYSNAIYLLSVFLALFLMITFATTRERVLPPKEQETNLGKDLKDLIRNRPWIILLVIGLLFNVYNSIKQGIVVIYFSHYLHNQLLAASFMVGLMLASIAGAMITSPLAKRLGKRQLFIYALIFSGVVNALLVFCGPGDIKTIFALGIISEFGAAIFPTLFFAMLGDAADYSEYKNGRRATGLVYSAGSFATKFGGGLAGAIIGFVLAAFHYNGQDEVAIQGAVPGIIMLMSWIPTIITFIAAGVMAFYPLNQTKMDAITKELNNRRANEVA